MTSAAANVALARVRACHDAVVVAEGGVRVAVGRRTLAVLDARRAGVTWGEIGEALGVTRQRAEQMARQ